MINIKKADLKDLDSLCDLENECFEKAWTKANIEAVLKDENSKVFLIKDDKKALAYIAYSKIIDEISLDRIGVSKLARRKSYASLLIEKMLEENLATSLEVSEKNIGARKLYEKYDFVIEGKRKDYYKIGEDALIMWRKIKWRYWQLNHLAMKHQLLF